MAAPPFSLWVSGGGCHFWACGTLAGSQNGHSTSSARHRVRHFELMYVSVVVVALALFREELRKHLYFLNTFFLKLPDYHPPLRGATQAPLLPEKFYLIS